MLWSGGRGGKRVQVRIDTARLFQEASLAKYSLQFKLDVTIYIILAMFDIDCYATARKQAMQGDMRELESISTSYLFIHSKRKMP